MSFIEAIPNFFQNGSLPQGWKDAFVTPIYKGKGSRSEPTNYRPISLTSEEVVKILEKVIRKALSEFFESSKFFSEQQFGFLAGRSTAQQLLRCVNEWSRCLDNGSPVDVIYLDVAKAFDSVSHEKLMLLLDRVGIGGNLKKWLQDFSTGRRLGECHERSATGKCTRANSFSHIY